MIFNCRDPLRAGEVVPLFASPFRRFVRIQVVLDADSGEALLQARVFLGKFARPGKCFVFVRDVDSGQQYGTGSLSGLQADSIPPHTASISLISQEKRIEAAHVLAGCNVENAAFQEACFI